MRSAQEKTARAFIDAEATLATKRSISEFYIAALEGKKLPPWSISKPRVKHENRFHSLELSSIPSVNKVDPIRNDGLRTTEELTMQTIVGDLAREHGVQRARRNSAMDLYRTLRTNQAQTDSAGIGPFDAQRVSFDHPSTMQSVQRDVLHDIHRTKSASIPPNYIVPEPATPTGLDMSYFSKKRVVDVNPRTDETTVAPELIEVMGLMTNSDTH